MPVIINTELPKEMEDKPEEVAGLPVTSSVPSVTEEVKDKPQSKLIVDPDLYKQYPELSALDENESPDLRANRLRAIAKSQQIADGRATRYMTTEQKNDYRQAQDQAKRPEGMDPDVPLADYQYEEDTVTESDFGSEEKAISTYRSALQGIDMLKKLGPAMDGYYNLTGEGDFRWDRLGSAVYDGVGQMAHAVNKGVVTGVDFIATPVEMLVGADPYFLTNKFEKYFGMESIPEIDGPADDILRVVLMSQEFVASGAPVVAGAMKAGQMASPVISNATNQGLKATMSEGILATGSKTAPKFAQDAILPAVVEGGKVDAVAGAVFQTVTDATGDEVDGLIAAVLAPMVPSLSKASFTAVTHMASNPTNTLEATMQIPKLLAVDLPIGTVKLTGKVIHSAPVVGTVYDWSANNIRGTLAGVKTALEKDDKLMSTGLKKVARDMILKIPDKKPTTETVIQELHDLQDFTRGALPVELPEVANAGKRAQEAENRINGILEKMGEPRKFRLTLDQVYGSTMEQIGAKEGFDELVDVIRFTYGNDYNKMVVTNRELFHKAVKGNWETLTENEREAFGLFFTDYVDDVTTDLDNMIHRAIGTEIPGITGDVRLDQLRYPQHRSTELYKVAQNELIPAMQTFKKELDTMYGTLKSMIPKDAGVDAAPMRDALVDIYDQVGAFETRKHIPAYVTDVTEALSKLRGQLDEVQDTSELVALRNREDELKTAIKTKSTEIRELRKTQKDARVSQETHEAKRAAAAEYDEAIATLQSEIDALHAESNAIPAQKRALREAGKKPVNAGNALGLVGDDLPLITTAEEALVADRIVRDNLSIAYREAKKQSTQELSDRIKRLERLKEGISDTLRTMETEHPAAFAAYEKTNKFYAKYVAADWNASVMGRVTELDSSGHYTKLSPQNVVDRLWTNADPRDIESFIRNFDGNLDELNVEAALAKANAPDSPLISSTFAEQSDKAIAAMRNIALNDLANTLDAIPRMSTPDPVVRMRKAEELIHKWVTDNRSKLELIPSLNDLIYDPLKVMDEISVYRQLAEEQQELLSSQSLRNVLDHITPGRTLESVMESDKDARELAKLIQDISDGVRGPKFDKALAKQAKELQGMTVVPSDLSAEHLKNLIARDFVDGFISNDLFRGDELLKKLDDKGVRNRMVMILGPDRVATIGAYARAASNISKTNVEMLTSLSTDKVVRSMQKLGLPMPRLVSQFTRRAVGFRPSHEWLAASIGANLLNHMAKQRTGHFLKKLMDNPFALTEVDNLIGSEIQKLTERQQRQITDVLQKKNRRLAEVVPLLTPVLTKPIAGYFAAMGYEMSTEEVEQVIESTLMNDPRDQEEPLEETQLTTEEIPEDVETEPMIEPEETQPENPKANLDELRALLQSLSPEERQALLSNPEMQ